MNIKSLIFISFSLIAYSCNKPTKVETKSNIQDQNDSESNDEDSTDNQDKNNQMGKTKNKGQTQAQPTDQAPVAVNLSSLHFMQGISQEIILNYSDKDQDLASSCQVTNLQSVTVTQACHCNSSGQCKVSLSSSLGAVGPGSFSFTVTANAAISNTGFATLNISPDLTDDDNHQHYGFGAGSFASISWLTDLLQLSTWSDQERFLKPTDSNEPFDTSGLVAYWQFNGYLDADEDSLADSSGKNHLLYSTNPASFTSGPFGDEVATLNGSNQGFVSPHHADLQVPDGSISFVFWMNVPDQAQMGAVFHKFQNIGPYGGYFLDFVDGGSQASKTLAFAFNDSSDANNRRHARVLSDLADGNWHQYAIVADKDQDSIRIYQDGKQMPVALTKLGAWPSLTNTEHFYISNPWGITSYLTGALDEFMIFKRALNPEEILNLYNRQATNFGGRLATFVSRVFNSGSTDTAWSSISWQPVSPAGKELPANLQPETMYSRDNASAGLLNALTGYWRLNGSGNVSQSDVILDDSGKNHHMTATVGGVLDLSYEQGKFKTGLNFRESNDFLTSDSHADFDLTGTDFTFHLWFNTDDSCASYCNLLYSEDSNNPQVVFYFEIAPDGTLDVYLTDGDNVGNGVTAASKTLVNDGRWHSAALTKEGPTLTLYVDGQVSGVSPAVYGNGSLDFSGFGLTINGSGESMNGSIDELTFWRRALSAPEIAQLNRRGVEQIKLQVRACSQADCSDATFVGPDGTNASYFSEALNSNLDFTPFTIIPSLQGRYPSTLGEIGI